MVYKVSKISNDKIYAIKIIGKRLLERYGLMSKIYNEKYLLKSDFEFIVKLKYSFQDQKNVYLVMEYVELGEFTKIIQSYPKGLPHKLISVYSREILLVL